MMHQDSLEPAAIRLFPAPTKLARRPHHDGTALYTMTQRTLLHYYTAFSQALLRIQHGIIQHS